MQARSLRGRARGGDPSLPVVADRLLVATARLHGLTLMTADRRLLGYPHAPTIDPRS